MTKIEHNDTYVLLRVLQIMFAVIVAGQAILILISMVKHPSLMTTSLFELLVSFTIVLGVSSVLQPIFWLFFQKVSTRFPRLVWVELVIDFQFGISWFLLLVTQMLAYRGRSNGDNTSSQEDAIKAGFEKLLSVCQIFIVISGVLWQTSGLMITRQIWKQRTAARSGDRRTLLEEHTFPRSLRSKPSTLSTARSSHVNHNGGPVELAHRNVRSGQSTSSTAPASPVNYNDMPLLEPSSSVIHWRPVSSSFGLEARSSPIEGAANGHAV